MWTNFLSTNTIQSGMLLISPWAQWVPELGLKIQGVQAPCVKLNSYKRYLEECTLVQWRLSIYPTGTADFIKKVLSVYTHSMTTIFLSLSVQVAKSTFFMKSPVAGGTFFVKSPDQSSEGPWKPSDPPLLAGEG